MRAFRVAYDGTPYYGFQRQPDVETVEGTLFRALDRLVGFEGAKPDGYAAAGRTDRGVSALFQTVGFEAPEWLTPAAFNSELPGHIRVWAAADARSGFHARYDARSREYTYLLHAPDIDIDRLRAALAELPGTHDFHNLTPEDGETTRAIWDARAERDGSFVAITLRADSFLQRLVRRLVSLVSAVAAGERDPTFLDRALSEERLSGPEGIASAPPEPLVLTDVAYGFEFAVDEEAAASARTVFERKRIDRETGARVAGRIAGELDG
ncbi:tRNA pseudouridine(38-40) synthase TruA [Halalkalicoccus subterraneus]|uniref:tRNA pseudouridine(38-40) synthase TruA n=1 Tax=Halalkalicoccus subterraneus TaxID=2675002 RepID=UPI000EFAB555|nr:tRNA pseudouridine(38-40) synthase TruA [Halalkalicoccus subterraneus]